MAKTYNHLWPQIIAFETLVEAWARTSKGRHRQRDVIAFEADLEPNLFAIQESLIQKTYCTGPYHRLAPAEGPGGAARPGERDRADLRGALH